MKDVNEGPRVEETPVTKGPRTELTQLTLDVQSPPPIFTPPPEKNDKWTYSETLRLVREILATRGVLRPLVRIWHKDGSNVRIGMAKGSKKVVLGEGTSFQDAFERVFLAPLKAREQALEAEGLTPLVASDEENEDQRE